MNHDEDKTPLNGWSFSDHTGFDFTGALFQAEQERADRLAQAQKERIKEEQAAQAEWDATLLAQLLRLVINILYIIALVIRAIAYYPHALITYVVRKVNDILVYIIDGLEP